MTFSLLPNYVAVPPWSSSFIFLPLSPSPVFQMYSKKRIFTEDTPFENNKLLWRWEAPPHLEALESIQNKSIPIVCLDGSAGTGKTLMAITEGINSIVRKNYDRLVLTRPYVGTGKEMGYLKGDVYSKMQPFMEPLLTYIQQWEEQHKMKFPQQKIDIVPLGFMRGQTLKRSYIIADEMSNSTPIEMEMLLTRLGEGSKLVLTGDRQQSDLGEETENGWGDLKYRLDRISRISDTDCSNVIRWHHFDLSCIRRHSCLAIIRELYEEGEKTNRGLRSSSSSWHSSI
jgi:phosphate starvation-inducible PhoH-like protein